MSKGYKKNTSGDTEGRVENGEPEFMLTVNHMDANILTRSNMGSCEKDKQIDPEKWLWGIT